MRKCEEYRVQQKVKKDKKLGLREICGLTEKRLVFGCDEKAYKNPRKKYRKRIKKYKSYSQNYKPKTYNPYYNNYKRKKFKRFRNTNYTRNRFRNKRKFRRKPFTKEKDKISECKCWNCNEKGHYANKCPKLKEKGIKYINSSQFIMNIEQIKEDDNNKWYKYEDFYVSQTDTDNGSRIEDINEYSSIESSSE